MRAKNVEGRGAAVGGLEGQLKASRSASEAGRRESNAVWRTLR